MSIQRLSPNGTETLLDHHLAVFDEWLRSQLDPWVSCWALPDFLTAITLVDQLNVDAESFNWRTFSVILQHEGAESLVPVAQDFTERVTLFNGTESQLAYPKIVSKFLMDPVRAGKFCVSCFEYVELAKQLLNILQDQ